VLKTSSVNSSTSTSRELHIDGVQSHPPGSSGRVKVSSSSKTGIVRINVTLMRVRVTIVAVEKQSVLHILNVCL